jgi:MFS family permease
MATAPIAIGDVHGGFRRLWHRELDTYPETWPRIANLAIVVVTTIVLYYEAYAGAGVGPLIIGGLHLSFTFYLYISVVSAAFGAFTSLIGGLSDRIGRANLTVAGSIVVAVLVLVGVPEVTTKWPYAILLVAVGFVEGIILVATPALVRDFSPQVGRAQAMGFWTLGPVAGSLIVAIVATNTLPHLHTWQSQFRIAGWVGLAMSVIALLFLRELSPEIRDQLMVTTRDKVLVEARARGMTDEDIQKALAHPWRQMLQWDLVGSAFAVSTFLLVYFAAVGFFVIYLTTTFQNSDGTFLSTAQANGIQQWMWAFNCGALVLVGFVSDRLRVRKPFMAVGALGTIATIAVWIAWAHSPRTGYYQLVTVVSLMAVFLGIAYGPWMASYTETVEDHNPALQATGLAVWGWILRVVVAISTLIVPVVVTSVTTIVNNSPYAAQAPRVLALEKQYGPVIAVAQKNSALLAELSKYPPNAIPPALLSQAVNQIGLQNLLTIQKIAPDLKYLSQVGPHLQALQSSVAKSPSQWQHWWWVDLAGAVLFLPFIFVMRGRWSPRKARGDAEAHERLVAEEMTKLGLGSGEPA